MEFRKHHLMPKGISLIEVLLVIGTLVVLLAIGANQTLASRRQASFKEQTSRVAQFVRETQNKSLTASQGKGWGVACSGNEVKRFAFTAAEPELSVELLTLQPGISCNFSVNQMKFEKLTGTPDAPTATMELSTHGLGARTIIIEYPGTITL